MRVNRKAISAGLFVAMAAVGCGQKTDIVFNIAKKPATADGRTVIEIKPNGKPRPAFLHVDPTFRHDRDDLNPNRRPPPRQSSTTANASISST